jgi:hypothetical protein
MVVTIYKANDTSYDITVRDYQNLPVNLTTAPITFTVYPYKEETGTVLFSRANILASGTSDEIEMTYPLSGICRLHIEPANTSGLAYQSYWYKLISTINAKVYTLSQDTFTVM